MTVVCQTEGVNPELATILLVLNRGIGTVLTFLWSPRQLFCFLRGPLLLFPVS